MFGRWFGAGGAGASYERGMAALQRAEYPSAIACFEEVLERTGPSDPLHQLAHFYRGDALGHLGRGALLRGDDAQALQHLDAALEASPNYPDLRLARAVARLRREDLAGALEDARTALRLNPRYLEALLIVGEAHRRLAEPQSASKAFVEAAEMARERDGDLAEALESGAEPSREELLDWILGESRRREAIQAARALLAQGFWSQARDEFAQLVAAHPRFPDLRCNLAQAHFQLGEHESARTELEAALELHPSYAEAALLLAVLELAQEQLLRAGELFELGEDNARHAGMASYGRAVCAYLLGRLGECEQRVRSLPDDFAPTHRLRLALALSRGDLKVARAALGESPIGDSDQELLDSCIAARILGDRDRFERALELLPGGAPNVEVALLRCDDQEHRPAGERVRCLQVACEEHPEATALRRALARAALDAGEPAMAMEQLESCRPALCAESQQLEFELLPAVGRQDLLCELSLAPPLPSLLNRLAALRVSGLREPAAALLSELKRDLPLDLRVRMQDAGAWAAPLLRRRPQAGEPHSAATKG